MKGYTQINVKKANMLYRRPANQNESDSSMTNKAHDTHLMLLVFLGDIALIKSCLINQLTPLSKSLHFQRFNLILSGQVFHVLLTNKHSLKYNQNDCFALFFET